MRGFAGQRGAGVAVGDGDLGGGVAEVGEEILRDGLDERVDLVEADAVAGVAVGGDGAGAEADDADVAWAVRRSRSGGRGRCRSRGRSRWWGVRFSSGAKIWVPCWMVPLRSMRIGIALGEWWSA